MANIKLIVHWKSERPNETDDNNGKHYGFYIFDCDEKDFDPEAGYGSYNVLDSFWYKTEEERDLEFNILF